MTELATQRIGFLGAGAMGEALAGGLLAAGVPRAQVRAADPDAARRDAVSRALGIATGDDNAAVVRESDVVVLAVKPALVPRVLADLRAALGDALAKPLWISIAAGVSIARIESELLRGARVVRAMPNTPALVRAGATAYAANTAATAADRALTPVALRVRGARVGSARGVAARRRDGPLGQRPGLRVRASSRRSPMPACGSGLPRDAAQSLAIQTVLGAAQLARDTGIHPAQLRDRVSSPGGTTIAGLARLEAAGFRAALLDAVEAATRRSRELGGS